MGNEEWGMVDGTMVDGGWWMGIISTIHYPLSNYFKFFTIEKPQIADLQLRDHKQCHKR